MARIYRAENIETGEVIEGEITEMAMRLGVARNTVYNAVSSEYKVHSKWRISITGKTNKTKNSAPIPILEEWDTVTEPFKEISRRK